MPSAMRPVAHGPDIPIPTPLETQDPVILNMMSVTVMMWIFSLKHLAKPQLFTQSELNDLE
jgi:hypothetical protein